MSLAPLGGSVSSCPENHPLEGCDNRNGYDPSPFRYFCRTASARTKVRIGPGVACSRVGLVR